MDAGPDGGKTGKVCQNEGNCLEQAVTLGGACRGG